MTGKFICAEASCRRYDMAVDEAVAEAYGWGDDWRAGLLTDDEILARLFRLNQARAGV